MGIGVDHESGGLGPFKRKDMGPETGMAEAQGDGRVDLGG